MLTVVWFAIDVNVHIRDICWKHMKDSERKLLSDIFVYKHPLWNKT